MSFLPFFFIWKPEVQNFGDCQQNAAILDKAKECQQFSKPNLLEMYALQRPYALVELLYMKYIA